MARKTDEQITHAVLPVDGNPKQRLRRLYSPLLNSPRASRRDQFRRNPIAYPTVPARNLHWSHLSRELEALSQRGDRKLAHWPKFLGETVEPDSERRPHSMSRKER